MPGFVSHANLIKKHFEDFLFVAALAFSFFYLLVHNLDGDSLVGLQIDSHLHPSLATKYLLKRPVPSLNTTRYFSSIIGQRSRYSWGSSRIPFICIINFGINLLYTDKHASSRLPLSPYFHPSQDLNPLLLILLPSIIQLQIIPLLFLKIYI